MPRFLIDLIGDLRVHWTVDVVVVAALVGIVCALAWSWMRKRLGLPEPAPPPNLPSLDDEARPRDAELLAAPPPAPPPVERFSGIFGSGTPSLGPPPSPAVLEPEAHVERVEQVPAPAGSFGDKPAHVLPPDPGATDPSGASWLVSEGAEEPEDPSP